MKLTEHIAVYRDLIIVPIQTEAGITTQIFDCTNFTENRAADYIPNIVNFIKPTKTVREAIALAKNWCDREIWNNQMKYPTEIEDQQDWVIIETMHGYYTDDGFGYMRSVRTIEEAIEDFKDNPKLYSTARVVNRKGEVLYNPNGLKSKINGLWQE